MRGRFFTMVVINKERKTVACCEVCYVKGRQLLKRSVPVYELLTI